MPDYAFTVPQGQPVRQSSLADMLTIARGAQAYQQEQQINPLELRAKQMQVEQAAAVNPLELAAEAVVATAFGERVRDVLRVADTNLLLTDYRVEEGDTLWGIAERAYGNGSRYTEIFAANKEVIEDPDLIFPGQKLRIPKG